MGGYLSDRKSASTDFARRVFNSIGRIAARGSMIGSFWLSFAASRI